MLYFVSDHLGSLAVITDSTGAVYGRQFYDPWGKERNADGSADTTCTLPAASPSTRGYTGQEEMASVCLINYNARIYDPMLGRIMSADDIVPDAFDGQSYNRYSYVDNGPLSAIDPTGHEPCGDPGCQQQQTETVDVTASRDHVTCDGGCGGSGLGGGQSGSGDGGDGGGGGGQGTETIVVTAPRLKRPPLYIATLSPLNLIGLIISPAEAAEMGEKPDPNGKRQCSPSTVAVAQTTYKSAGQVSNLTGYAGAALAVLAVGAAATPGLEEAAPPLALWAARLSGVSLVAQSTQVAAGAVVAQQTGNSNQFVASGAGLVAGGVAAPLKEPMAGAIGAAMQEGAQGSLPNHGQPSCP
jgi:RHS repeat-associated protein